MLILLGEVRIGSGRRFRLVHKLNDNAALQLRRAQQLLNLLLQLEQINLHEAPDFVHFDLLVGVY